MPTGYTAAIKDGITFEQFALGCARAFGALVMMRDDDSDAKIPEAFLPDEYHKKQALASREELKKLEVMTSEEAASILLSEYELSESNRLKRLQETRDTALKYKAMLWQAKAYVAPTPDHVELKKFMIEQIEESMRFDCNEDFYNKPSAKVEVETWLLDKKKRAIDNITYHELNYSQEVDRTNSRNAWIKSLRDSLVEPVIPAASMEWPPALLKASNALSTLL